MRYRVRLGPKTVFVLGSEAEGVSKPIEKLADLQVTIPGTGLVESLNVSGGMWNRTRHRLRPVGQAGGLTKAAAIAAFCTRVFAYCRSSAAVCNPLPPAFSCFAAQSAGPLANPAAGSGLARQMPRPPPA